MAFDIILVERSKKKKKVSKSAYLLANVKPRVATVTITLAKSG